MDALKQLQQVFQRNRNGEGLGVYSVCSAHPLVIEAAMIQAREDGSPLLIEATANQVNQFGGYTGMKPVDFPSFVAAIARRAGFDIDRIVLGGDHLGPVCWTDESSESALEKSRELVAAYVSAGFTKIHLDTSMPCADDGKFLDDATVAARAAILCEAAECAAARLETQLEPIYVIGTEVPQPGGAREKIERLRVTAPEGVRRTVAMHRRAFENRGLGSVWSRVVGLVVQPGVEFDHSSVECYRPSRARHLTAALENIPGLIFEAHSTDYQPAAVYSQLVRDHFAILKVGPQLTFALREALFALSAIEQELMGGTDACSRLPEVCDCVMAEHPEHWLEHYPAQESRTRWYRRHSYSDRIRYYWSHPDVAAAVDRLFANLDAVEIPPPLLSQFLPAQYLAVRDGDLPSRPKELALHRIMQVTSVYSAACRGKVHTDQSR